jgi:hypothetical protein
VVCPAQPAAFDALATMAPQAQWRDWLAAATEILKGCPPRHSGRLFRNRSPGTGGIPRPDRVAFICPGKATLSTFFFEPNIEPA